MSEHNPALAHIIALQHGFEGGETLDQARAAMETFVAQHLPTPSDTVVEPEDASGVPAEWLSCPGAATVPVTLYLHGGSYVAGSPRSFREFGARLATASGGRVLLADYRLAPEHPCPAAIEDAVAAYRWLLARGVDPRHIVVAGDSAGGGLAISALVAIRDARLPLPAAGVCLCPWTDLALTGDSLTTRAPDDPFLTREGLATMAALYLDAVDPREPRASPLNAELRGLPPLLIQIGTADILHDDATRLAERAEAAGVAVTLSVWDDMPHCWQLWAALLPEGARAVEQVGSFIRTSVENTH